MGKIYKILVAGKKAIGKTMLLEQLIYNRLNEKYFPTIEDIYVSYWEREKSLKEKFRFYDTKGMENAYDIETIDTYRYLFLSIDACLLIYSSNDADSYACIEKIKNEIDKEKLKEKSKELVHFIAIDYDLNTLINNKSSIASATPTATTIMLPQLSTTQSTITSTSSSASSSSVASTASQIKLQFQPLKNVIYYEIPFDKRDLLLKIFNEIAITITQVSTKSSMNIVQSIKKQKGFLSSK